MLKLLVHTNLLLITNRIRRTRPRRLGIYALRGPRALLIICARALRQTRLYGHHIASALDLCGFALPLIATRRRVAALDLAAAVYVAGGHTAESVVPSELDRVVGVKVEGGDVGAALGWSLRRGGVAGGGEAPGTGHAEGGIVPGGFCGVAPETRHVKDVVERVVDAAVSGFVLELQRCVVSGSHLVTDIDASCGDPHSSVIAAGKLCCCSLVVDGIGDERKVVVELSGFVHTGATTSTDSLHWAGFRTTPSDDCTDSCLAHHFYEKGAGRRAEAVGEDDDVLGSPGLRC
jgi:hypothetical protein